MRHSKLEQFTLDCSGCCAAGLPTRRVLWRVTRPWERGGSGDPPRKVLHAIVNCSKSREGRMNAVRHRPEISGISGFRGDFGFRGTQYRDFGGHDTDFLIAPSFASLRMLPAYSRSPGKAGPFALSVSCGLRRQGTIAQQVRQCFTGGRARRRRLQVSIFQPEGLLHPSLSG